MQFYTFSRFYPKLLYPGDASPDQSRMRLSDAEAIPIIDWANPFSWFKTGLLIAKWSPHIVIFPWWMWGWVIPFMIIGKAASLRRNTKVIFICHNVTEHETTPWKVLLSRLVLSIGDTFIVHSQGDHDHIKKIFPGARVIRSFHPTYETFRHGQISKEEAKAKLGVHSKFRKTVLFFGIVRPYKGLTYLIEAMSRIVVQLPDLCLLIVGEFWESKETYLHQLSELKIESNVKVIDGYVRNEDVATYFSAADVVVLPYVSGTGSGVVQIAFGFNKPVIATRVGCLSEVVEDGKTGLLVEPKNAVNIADAVILFYKHNMGHRMAKNIWLGRNRFAWSNMVNRIEKIVQNKCKQRQI